jgi:hypothetical protein
MIAVAHTSPICYLIPIGEIGLLPKLYYPSGADLPVCLLVAGRHGRKPPLLIENMGAGIG